MLVEVAHRRVQPGRVEAGAVEEVHRRKETGARVCVGHGAAVVQPGVAGDPVAVLRDEVLAPRPTGELATFIVSAVALLVVLFFPGGFLGAALSREARS